MDFKLIKMLKTNFLFVFLFFFSCSVPKELKEERKDWDFDNWPKKYKDRAFCLCVLKGYENKKIEKTLTENDRSFYDVLGIAIFDNSLKPIINQEIKKIRLDSINTISAYPEDLKTIYQKRQVIGHCLDFYNSKELDDLANKEKKNWDTISSISNEIHKKILTY